jgi:hypothetical protein
MSAPFGWGLAGIAAAAAAVAVIAGTNLPVAVPAAALAVLAASLLFVRAWTERAEAARELGRPTGTDTDRMRLAFRTGRLGREEIVVTLNRLERSFRDGGLPPPTVEELTRVAALPADAFLRYVREHLDRLEAAA